MRVSFALVLSLLLAGVAVGAASAETRLSSRIVGGVGVGGGVHHGLDDGGGAYFVAADLLWRRRPMRSLLITLEGCGTAGGGTRLLGEPRVLAGPLIFPAPRYLDYVRHESILIGLERSRDGPGFGPFFHGGIGMGLITVGDSPTETTAGLALGGGAGFQLVSPARELGLALGLRTSHVIASGAHSHFFAVTFGAAINPR